MCGVAREAKRIVQPPGCFQFIPDDVLHAVFAHPGQLPSDLDGRSPLEHPFVREGLETLRNQNRIQLFVEVGVFDFDGLVGCTDEFHAVVVVAFHVLEIMPRVLAFGNAHVKSFDVQCWIAGVTGRQGFELFEVIAVFVHLSRLAQQAKAIAHRTCKCAPS